jgi:DNA modification methylase
VDKIGPFELNRAHCGDATEMLRRMPDESVQCCVSSPPYWNFRDYGVVGQIGLEKSIQEYIVKITTVFEEVRRVLRKDGTCWINLGDSYAGGKIGRTDNTLEARQNLCRHGHSGINKKAIDGNNNGRQHKPTDGLKPKDLCGIPWRVAFALQAAGWYLRCDVIWSKPNPMPESVEDRPTKSHEYLFLLAKSQKYYYDAEAIKEPCSQNEMANGFRGGAYTGNETFDNAASGKRKARGNYKVPSGWDQGEGAHGNFHREGRAKPDKQRGHGRRHVGFNDRWDQMPKSQQCGMMRNKRDVWEIATHAFPEAHFATFPPALVEPCILAGSRPGDVILDPFSGSGTTGMVALQHDRKFIGFDLNPEYCQKLAAPRLAAAERGQTLEEYQAGQLTIFDLEARR